MPFLIARNPIIPYWVGVSCRIMSLPEMYAGEKICSYVDRESEVPAFCRFWSWGCS